MSIFNLSVTANNYISDQIGENVNESKELATCFYFGLLYG